MPQSMTGFGRAVCDTPHGRLLAEIRTVNSRFSEPRVRLPADALDLEMRLRDRIKSSLARGKIDCSIRLEPLPGAMGGGVNADLLRRTVSELQRASAHLPLEGGVTLEAALRAMPREDSASELWRSESFQREVEAVLGDALDALSASRAEEGERIGALLGSHIDQIEQAVSALREAAPQVAARYEQRLRERIEDLEKSQGVAADAGRVEQELVHFAQRVDITEEIDRLEVHCGAFRDLLASADPVGRKMDFLVQEILREINTTGSKARDAGITGVVVDLKVVAEQMREQVQNIE